MLKKLAKFFDKVEIPLNKEGIILQRDATSVFYYTIEEDWSDPKETYWSAIDHEGMPIVFPGSDVGISGKTEEEVRSRMLDAYPYAMYSTSQDIF